MSTTKDTPSAKEPIDAALNIPSDHIVIATVVQWNSKVALFKRSRGVGHDSGLWHCITGFLEAETTPAEQALQELLEETGLQAKDLIGLRQGPVLVVLDDFGTPWLVHTFTALTTRRRLALNWEHDSYRWVAPGKATRFANRVPWLDDVLAATGYCRSGSTSNPGPTAARRGLEVV